MDVERIERLPRRQLADVYFEALRRTFPTPYPVELRWAAKLERDGRRLMGDTSRRGRRLVIRLSALDCTRRFDVIETLRHEYAHAMDWRHDRVELTRCEHPDEFWLALGRLYRAWHGEP